MSYNIVPTYVIHDYDFIGKIAEELNVSHNTACDYWSEYAPQDGEGSTLFEREDGGYEEWILPILSNFFSANPEADQIIVMLT